MGLQGNGVNIKICRPARRCPIQESHLAAMRFLCNQISISAEGLRNSLLTPWLLGM